MKVLLLFCLTLCFGVIVNSQTRKADKKTNQKEKSMTKLAKGTFEVKMTPLAVEKVVGDPTIGRLGMTKQFAGELDGTRNVQMLGTQSEAVEGSGGYVAMERFNGTLGGKK